MSSPLCAECKSPSPGFLEEGTGRFFCGSSCQYAFIEGGQKRPREEEEEKKDIDNLLEAWKYLQNLPGDNEAYVAVVKQLDTLLKESITPGKEETFKKIIESEYESIKIDPFLLILNEGNEDLAVWYLYNAQCFETEGVYIEVALRKNFLKILRTIFGGEIASEALSWRNIIYANVQSVEQLELLLSEEEMITPIDFEPYFDYVQKRWTTGLLRVMLRDREDLALYLLQRGANPYRLDDRFRRNLLLEWAISENMRELAILAIRKYGMNPLAARDEPGSNHMIMDWTYDISFKMTLLVEFYTQEFLKNNLAPQHNVSLLLASRTLQGILCEKLSDQSTNKNSLKRDLLKLAESMKVPQSLLESWKDFTPEQLCEHISEILAFGGVWDASNAQRYRREAEERLSYFERFTRGLDYLKVHWRGRNFDEVLEELRRKTQ